MNDIRKELEERIAKGWIKSIDCDAGWDWILADLNAKLKYLDFNYKITQVKEKFGTLRFYYEPLIQKQVVLDIMDDVVQKAEELSASTCELCGNSSRCSIARLGVKYDQTVGIKYNGGWYKTLCNSCAEPIGYRASKEEEGWDD